MNQAAILKLIVSHENTKRWTVVDDAFDFIESSDARL